MIPNRELVVYCLYLAGGATRSIHTEDVAKKCWEHFPDAFSWMKYPEYPDKDIVRVALTDARKGKYGALVSGRVEGKHGDEGRNEADGWVLTETGLGWITENLPKFEGDSAGHERKAHRQVLLRRSKELKSSELFRRFSDEGAAFSPGIGELAAFFRCRVDASPSVWAKRTQELKRLGLESDDEALVSFADSCAAAYSQQI